VRYHYLWWTAVWLTLTLYRSRVNAAANQQRHFRRWHGCQLARSKHQTAAGSYWTVEYFLGTALWTANTAYRLERYHAMERCSFRLKVCSPCRKRLTLAHPVTTASKRRGDNTLPTICSGRIWLHGRFLSMFLHSPHVSLMYTYRLVYKPHLFHYSTVPRTPRTLAFLLEERILNNALLPGILAAYA